MAYALKAMSSEVTVVVKNPYATSDSFYMVLPTALRVCDLKKRLSVTYPSHPPIDTQRIIHCGRLCADDDTLKSLLSHSADDSVTLHLAIKPVDTALPLPTAGSAPYPPPMMLMPPYAMMNMTPYQYGYYNPYQLPPYAPMMPMTLPTPTVTVTAAVRRAAQTQSDGKRFTSPKRHVSVGQTKRSQIAAADTVAVTAACNRRITKRYNAATDRHSSATATATATERCRRGTGGGSVSEQRGYAAPLLRSELASAPCPRTRSTSGWS